MAFGWITALKIIPWKDVLENAPHIVKAAKNLYAGTKKDTSSSSEDSDSVAFTSDSENTENRDCRINRIEKKVLELNDEQDSSIELIRSLAKQNIRIVEAIEVLRVRSKILLYTCILFGSISAGLILLLILK